MLGAAVALAACAPSTGTNPSPSAALKPSVNELPSSPAQVLTNLRMATTTTGWAAAYTAGETPIGNLVRTTDGGMHWRTIVLPSDRLGGSILKALDAHDEQQAWALVMFGAYSTASHELAAVLATNDGGRSWSSTPAFGIDGDGTGVQFIDAMHGWVFATPSAGGVIGASDTTLYRTIDGGLHWQAVKPPSQVRGDATVKGGLPETCPMGGPISRPTFVDPLTGWLGAFCNRLFFYETHDGGLGWSPQNLPTFPGAASSVPSAELSYNVDSFQAISTHDLSVVVHRGITTGGNALQDAALYTSHDAGASWSAFRLPYPELTADFVTPSTGWMIAAAPGGDTEHRSLYSTVDGGRSWRLVSGPEPYFNGSLDFLDTSNGFIADGSPPDSSSLLLRTSDGGTSWTRLRTVVN